MLQELRISNFALIERAAIVPGEGFNVLTGETGAGKSILIAAFGLLLGNRATGDNVGGGATKAVIEGAFDLANAPRVRRFLEENGLESDDSSLIITREVEKSGRSKVRLNGRMATGQTLAQVGELLVDFHGQHANQHLLKPEAHLGFLDAFGDARHAANRQKTREAYRSWREAERRLTELTQNEQARAQRLDMLQFQATEIDKAKLQAGEDEELEEERTKLWNSEKLRSAAGLCRDLLLGDDEPGAISLGQRALKSAKEIQNIDSSIGEWTAQLQSALLELEDVASSARDYADALDADPHRLEEIEGRLYRISRLKRKYGASVGEILEHRATIETEINDLTLSDEQLAGLRDEAGKRKAEFLAIAEKLSAARQKLAKSFTGAVVQELGGLAMDKARLEISFGRQENGSNEGVDKIEFVFSANPGQELRPLTKIASGGEISRVMLALRSVLREKRGTDDDEAGVPIVVFDEVDTGIGGLTAEKVGEKMQEIAGGHQVFCITHLPQIAKRADHHFRVEKQSGRDFTSVSVVGLEGEDRIVELARMMGSESKANLQHARELLGDARVAA
ncbi:DNA repair protein RecN [Abditibacteriota bacterium]|nr:DNA repair protein RecN [Abditibacteriota bacterium]